MAIRTQSLVPFKINNIPDRYTIMYVADPTVVTATASGASATKRLNRLQSGSFTMATGVVDVVEMGSKFRPGGVDSLGEISWNLSWNAVSVANVCALTGTSVPTVANTTLSWGSDNMNNSTVDFIRLVADNGGTVFGTLYMQDAITSDYGVDASEGGVVMESASGKGPSSLFFPGFVLPKTYLALSGDVTAGYLNPTSIFSASEQAVQVFQPSNGQPPSYWQQNGAVYFLKIEKVPGANLANTPTRYFENVVASTQSAIAIGSAWVTPTVFAQKFCQVGNQIDVFNAGLTAISETVTITAVASQVNTTNTGAITAGAGVVVTPTGGTGMLGIVTGVSLTIGGASPEVVLVTATTSTTFTATYANSHAAGVAITTPSPSFQATFTATHASGADFCGHLSVAQNFKGQAAYIAASNKLFLGDTFVAGDLFRLTYCSYNTDTSLPLTVPATPPDTTDRAGVSTRLIPLKINGGNTNRVQKASLKMTLKRDHVQGIGENAIAYGISSVPDVAVDLDAKETDLGLLAQIQTGSPNLTSQGASSKADFEDLNYITRNNLANQIPVSITLYDPFNAAAILAVWNTPQFIPTSIGYSSSNKSDNTIKVTGMDITGNMTMSYTVPQ